MYIRVIVSRPTHVRVDMVAWIVFCQLPGCLVYFMSSCWTPVSNELLAVPRNYRSLSKYPRRDPTISGTVHVCASSTPSAQHV